MTQKVKEFEEADVRMRRLAVKVAESLPAIGHRKYRYALIAIDFVLHGDNLKPVLISADPTPGPILLHCLSLCFLPLSFCIHIVLSTIDKVQARFHIGLSTDMIKGVVLVFSVCVLFIQISSS